MSTIGLGRNFKLTADGKIKKVQTYSSASARIKANKNRHKTVRVVRPVAKG